MKAKIAAMRFLSQFLFWTYQQRQQLYNVALNIFKGESLLLKNILKNIVYNSQSFSCTKLQFSKLKRKKCEYDFQRLTNQIKSNVSLKNKSTD